MLPLVNIAATAMMTVAITAAARAGWAMSADQPPHPKAASPMYRATDAAVMRIMLDLGNGFMMTWIRVHPRFVHRVRALSGRTEECPTSAVPRGGLNARSRPLPAR